MNNFLHKKIKKFFDGKKSLNYWTSYDGANTKIEYTTLVTRYTNEIDPTYYSNNIVIGNSGTITSGTTTAATPQQYRI